MAIIEISVRQAKPGDAKVLAQIHNAAWRNAYSGIIPGQTLNRMILRRNTANWSRVLKNAANVSVLLFAEKVAGYALIRGNADRRIKAKGEISELYLSPEYQGVGLGRRLFLDAQKRAFVNYGSGCVVWVLNANSPARRFYEIMGGRAVAKAVEQLGGANLEKTAYLWH